MILYIHMVSLVIPVEFTDTEVNQIEYLIIVPP